jgi:hypothetical protein
VCRPLRCIANSSHAHFLITQQNKRPADIYLEVGFEALSHFSYAFKKQFGQLLTDIAKCLTCEPLARVYPQMRQEFSWLASARPILSLPRAYPSGPAARRSGLLLRMLTQSVPWARQGSSGNHFHEAWEIGPAHWQAREAVPAFLISYCNGQPNPR